MSKVKIHEITFKDIEKGDLLYVEYVDTNEDEGELTCYTSGILRRFEKAILWNDNGETHWCLYYRAFSESSESGYLVCDMIVNIHKIIDKDNIISFTKDELVKIMNKGKVIQ